MTLPTQELCGTEAGFDVFKNFQLHFLVVGHLPQEAKITSSLSMPQLSNSNKYQPDSLHTLSSCRLLGITALQTPLLRGFLEPSLMMKGKLAMLLITLFCLFHSSFSFTASQSDFFPCSRRRSFAFSESMVSTCLLRKGQLRLRLIFSSSRCPLLAGRIILSRRFRFSLSISVILSSSMRSFFSWLMAGCPCRSQPVDLVRIWLILLRCFQWLRSYSLRKMTCLPRPSAPFIITNNNYTPQNKQSLPVLRVVQDVVDVFGRGRAQSSQSSQLGLYCLRDTRPVFLAVEQGHEDGDVAEALVVQAAVEVNQKHLLRFLPRLHLLLYLLQEDARVHELIQLSIVLPLQHKSLDGQQDSEGPDHNPVLPSVLSQKLEHQQILGIFKLQ